METTKLRHTILYAKGWYRVSFNVYDDLRATLKADGYSTEFFSDDDIVRGLLNRFEECEFQSASSELSHFIMDVIGDTKAETHNNIINKILGKFRFIDSECWNKGAPDYNKVLPLPESKTLKTIREMFEDFN
jgi:hypothetical protein